MIVEIIVTNQLEAVTAETFGANRLELIHSFEHGGLSPALELTKTVCDAVNIPINVMLRPHNNLSFNYSKADTVILLQELEYIRDHTHANGIVFGALDINGNIDTALLTLIIANKGHLTLTFHRAIDASTNIIDSYRLLLDTAEVDWVLTSGGKNTALHGLDVIKEMQYLHRDHANATIIAGSGVTPENVLSIIKQTVVSEIHLGTGVRTGGILMQAKFEELHKQLKFITANLK